ncbi:hypothetical protein SELMODRAFT_412752 [Selaginella moellendorffii]|uniref:Terpene synthase n=1 Tax=Selaginella moellendorffii TaxID=88036 RepID=D8RLC9_SELML|nr:hypothetical protein SELMODRAFT_412752 [Selaginella moellendorffii]
MARTLFNDMLKQAALPDIVTFSTLVEGYCNAGLVDDAERLLEEIIASDCSPDVYTYTSLVDSFCKVKRMVEAHRVLKRMAKRGCQPNVVTYTALIDAFCRAGKPTVAYKLLEEMVGINNDVQPNVQELASVGLGTWKRLARCSRDWSATRTARRICSHTGGLCQGKELSKAMEVLEEMTLSRKGRPNAEAYEAVIQELAREGRHEEANALADELLGNKGHLLSVFKIHLGSIHCEHFRSGEKLFHSTKSRLGLLAAYVYPTIPYEKIVPVAKFIAWFFLADDILDSPEISSSDIRYVATAYKMVFKGRFDEATLPVKNPELLRQMKMLAEVLEELSLHIVDESGRFVDAMTKVLDMFEIESSWLRKQIIPNLDTYLWLREITSGVAPCFALIDGLLQLRLEERGVLDHPLIRKVEEIGTHHIALHNDLILLRKEYFLASDYDVDLPSSEASSTLFFLLQMATFMKYFLEDLCSHFAARCRIIPYKNVSSLWMDQSGAVLQKKLLKLEFTTLFEYLQRLSPTSTSPGTPW